MTPTVNKNTIDVGKTFTTYVAFLGDVEKTAVALDLDPQVVRDLAQVEAWPDRVKQWNELRSGDPRDVQIHINRAVNYVQAHRLRSILDVVIADLGDENKGSLVERLTVQGKHGPEFKTRALTDLVKAAEAVQLMTARALGDTVDERPESDRERPGSSIALQVISAMGAANDIGLDSVAVVRKQLEQESQPLAPSK